MPEYEYSAWVTVRAENEQLANLLLDDAQTEMDRVFGEAVKLSIEDGPPDVASDDEEEEDV